MEISQKDNKIPLINKVFVAEEVADRLEDYQISAVEYAKLLYAYGKLLVLNPLHINSVMEIANLNNNMYSYPVDEYIDLIFGVNDNYIIILDIIINKPGIVRVLERIKRKTKKKEANLVFLDNLFSANLMDKEDLDILLVDLMSEGYSNIKLFRIYKAKLRELMLTKIIEKFEKENCSTALKAGEEGSLLERNYIPLWSSYNAPAFAKLRSIERKYIIKELRRDKAMNKKSDDFDDILDYMKF